MKNIPVSICMLTYNDAPYLEQSLQKLKLLGCELVIVDLGSTDGSAQIASQYADQFASYEDAQESGIQNLIQGCIDEGKARNMAASMAKNAWILSVAPTESIVFFDGKKFYTDVQGKEPLIGQAAVTEITGSYAGKQIAFHRQSRLYNKEYHCFKGVIYPKMIGIAKENATDVKTKNITLSMEIIHKSFLRSTDQARDTANNYLKCIEERKKVCLREQSALPMQIFSEHAESTKQNLDREIGTLFFMEGVTYLYMENWSMAIRSFEQALQYEGALPTHTLYKLIEKMSFSYCRIHQEKAALELTERYETILQDRHGRQTRRQNYFLNEGYVYLENGNMTKAREYFEKGIAMGNYDKKGSQMIDAFQKLGSIYQTLQLEKEAEHCIWEQIRLIKKYDALIQKYT